MQESYKEYQRRLIKPIIQQLDSIPYGKRVESEWQPDEGFIYNKIDLGGVQIEQLLPKELKTETVLFHIHGGGYAYSLVDAYRATSVVYSKLAGGAEVLNIDYRTAPTDKYPAALEDCVKAYNWLLNQGYDSQDIVFIGDSAGGDLVLAVTLYLRDHGVPLPKGVIAISPWADLKFELKSRKENINNDVVLGNGGLKLLEEVKKPSYVGNEDINNPYISAINGNYTGFPPLLIQAGSHEILLDDGLEVYRKAKAAGVKVKHSLYEGMSHDFQILLPELQESKEALKEIKEFIQELSKIPFDEERFIKEQRKLFAPYVEMYNNMPQGIRKELKWQAPEGYKLERFNVAGVPVEHIVPLNKKSNRVVFQLHGGGYVLGLLEVYGKAAVAYSKMAGGAEVFTIDYRVAPTDKYPAALEDAVNVYKWILGQGYDNKKIIFIGDSAGGNLDLVTALYLKDQNIPLPQGIIAISPWCKLIGGADSIKRNSEKDSLLGKYGVNIASEVEKSTYMGDNDYKNPYLSPVYGNFKGFPNLLIIVGSYEVLLDDILETSKRIETVGVNVTTKVYEKMSHVFPMLLSKSPKGRDAWQEMSSFVERIL